MLGIQCHLPKLRQKQVVFGVLVELLGGADHNVHISSRFWAPNAAATLGHCTLHRTPSEKHSSSETSCTGVWSGDTLRHPRCEVLAHQHVRCSHLAVHDRRVPVPTLVQVRQRTPRPARPCAVAAMSAQACSRTRRRGGGRGVSGRLGKIVINEQFSPRRPWP